MFCPSCGKEIASQSKFCIACGNAIHIPDIQQNSTTDLGDSIQVDSDLPDSEIGITQEQIEPTLDEMGDSKKITIGSFEVDKRLVGGFVALLVIFSVVLLSSGEEKLDLYIEYGVLCPSCEGPIEADIDTISGSTDSVLGFPDEDGQVSWSFQYEISESESDSASRRRRLEGEGEGPIVVCRGNPGPIWPNRPS